MTDSKIAAANTIQRNVTVACKLPHGLILRGGIMVERDEPIMGGGFRAIKSWQGTGQQVRIRGYAVRAGTPSQADLTGGFAMTSVDANFWEAWLEMNKQHPAVVSGLLFAMSSLDQASDKARERAAVTCGLEPLRRKDDGMIEDLRVPRNVNGALKAGEPAPF